MGQRDGEERTREPELVICSVHLSFLYSQMLPSWKCVEGGWKGLMALHGADVSMLFQLWDTNVKYELWNDMSGFVYPLWGGRWRADDLASCGYYSPLEHQLMLICHTRPKNVKNEGEQGVHEASSLAFPSTLRELAWRQMPGTHMCTLTQKYWRINSSQASGGGSYANSAALTYSKRVSSLA